MEIKVMSQKEAIEYLKDIDKKVSVISITELNEKDVEFFKNQNILDILRLKFNDCIDEYNGRIPPKKEDLLGLKEFVNKLQCEELIVHCYGGVSRSAAVAAAIGEYMNIYTGIFEDPDYLYHPNMLVYKYAKDVLY